MESRFRIAGCIDGHRTTSIAGELTGTAGENGHACPHVFADLTTKSGDTDTQHSRAGPVIPSSRFWQGRPETDYNGYAPRTEVGVGVVLLSAVRAEAFVIRTRIGSRAVRRAPGRRRRGLRPFEGAVGLEQPVRPPRPVLCRREAKLAGGRRHRRRRATCSAAPRPQRKPNESQDQQRGDTEKHLYQR